MTRLADDFEAIRARRNELAREHEAVLSQKSVDEVGAPLAPVPGHLEAFHAGHADAEMLHAIYGDAGKASAHAEAIGPADEVLAACAVAIARRSNVEFTPGPLGWIGVVGPFEFGPYPLARALAIAGVLSEMSPR